MKASKRQFLNKVDGIDGLFATKTGAEVSAAANKVWDGGKLRPEIIAGPAETGDIVLTRPFDPEQHQALVLRLKKQVGIWRTTISVQPTSSDLTAANVPPEVHPGALLINVKAPEADAASGDQALLELTFAVSE
jgi:hypothetical protein